MVCNLTYLLSSITSGKIAMTIPGVGAKIGAKIDEFLSTGQLAKLEKIAADPTAQVMWLLTSIHTGWLSPKWLLLGWLLTPAVS